MVSSMGAPPSRGEPAHRSSGSTTDIRSSDEVGTEVGSAHIDPESLRSIQQQRDIWLDLSRRATALVDLCVHTTLSVTVADLECAHTEDDAVRVLQ